MSNIALHLDPLNTPSPYSPVTSPVASSVQSFVSVTVGTEKKNVILVGDVAASHATTSNPIITHAAAKMDEKEKFFFTINSIPVIIDDDPADCMTTHKIVASGFVNVVP